jgi:hypothetical protein
MVYLLKMGIFMDFRYGSYVQKLPEGKPPWITINYHY